MCLVLGIDAFLFKVRVAYSPFASPLMEFCASILNIASLALHTASRMPLGIRRFLWAPWTLQRGISCWCFLCRSGDIHQEELGPWSLLSVTMFIVQVLGIVQLSMFLDVGLQRLQGARNSQRCFLQHYFLMV